MTVREFDFVLFPGRHHVVTGFQIDYLSALLGSGAVSNSGVQVVPSTKACVVWAVTSSSHSLTRRNPVSGSRRLALVESVASAAKLPSLVVGIPDTPAFDGFAKLVINTVNMDLPFANLSPANTIVACSTPSVSALYSSLGFEIIAVEDGVSPEPVRPWQAVEDIAAGGSVGWDALHPATQSFWSRYALTQQVRDLFTDPVVSADGDLTDTRNYRTYAQAFETASARKFDIVGEFLQPGRVVDIGCATGGLLEQVAADPRFVDSDLFGVDIAQPLLMEAEHKKQMGVFANPNIWFVRANVLNTDVMPAASIDSTVTVALTHEICSYGHGVDDVKLFAERIFTHTRPGGVWVNSDVVGPSQPDKLVELVLCTSDGENVDVSQNLDALGSAEVSAFVSSLSTSAKLPQFAYDFSRLSGKPFAVQQLEAGRWVLPLWAAMEFMTRKDYNDNWLSECHERFCDLSLSSWQQLLTQVGFTLDARTSTSLNSWLVENRFDPVAALFDAQTKEPLAWPETHVLSVATRPFV